MFHIKNRSSLYSVGDKATSRPPLVTRWASSSRVRSPHASTGEARLLPVRRSMARARASSSSTSNGFTR